MAEIVLFPSDTTVLPAARQDVSDDRFLLDEGLDLLADFRSIRDDAVRASLRGLVKAMATASRAGAGS